MNTESTYIKIGQAILKMEWDDNELSSYFNNLFSPWHTQHVSHDYLISVKKMGSKYLINFPDAEIIENCFGEALVHIEYNLTLLAQKLLSNNLQLHGSSFGIDGSCVLISGGHGSGKTTLALTAISDGCHALTDDICTVTDDCTEVIGFPRPFKATKDTWEMDPRPVPADCPHQYAVSDITYVFFHNPAGKYFVPKARLRYVFFPTRRPGAASMNLIGQTDALGRLLMQGFNYSNFGESGTVRRLILLLQNAKPYELYYESAWDAVNLVKNRLRT